MFCLTNWVHTPDGYVADLPEGVGYSVLAEPRFSSEINPRRTTEQPPIARPAPPAILGFGLFDALGLVEIPPNCSAERIPPALAELIYAAQQYAPALVLARAEMRKLHLTSREEFVKVLSECLRRRLAAQITDPYFLALATQSQTGYIAAASYYWIVGYNPKRPEYAVKWVSADYYVYANPIEYFDLDPKWLAARFGVIQELA